MSQVRLRLPLAASLAMTLLAAPLLSAPAAAQQSVVTDSTSFQAPRGVPSARGAFVRSLLVPGWGQLAAHAPVRALVYFTADGGSWFMLLKTLHNLRAAQDWESGNRATARDSILSLAETDTALAGRLAKDPLLLDDMISADPAVTAAHSLVTSRKSQRQDWITQVVFWTLASAADAYVTTQLSDFPGEVSITPRPGGAVALSWALPLRRPW